MARILSLSQPLSPYGNFASGKSFKIIHALEVTALVFFQLKAVTTVLIAAQPVMSGVQATIKALNPPWLIAPFQAHSTNGPH